MKDYINRFRTYAHNGKTYSLEFFAYVYGKKFENMSNFGRIIKEAGVPGAVISASELLKLRNQFERNKISKEKIWDLFRRRKEVTSFDY